jgi:hypothetical protein
MEYCEIMEVSLLIIRSCKGFGKDRCIALCSSARELQANSTAPHSHVVMIRVGLREAKSTYKDDSDFGGHCVLIWVVEWERIISIFFSFF